MSTLQDNRIKEIAPLFVWVRLDPEKYRELGDKYGVKEIPSFVVINHEKEKLNRKNCEGHAFVEDLYELIKEVKGKVKFIKPEELEKIRDCFEKARKYLEENNLDKAVDYLRKVVRTEEKIGYVEEAKKAIAMLEENARAQIEKAKKLVEIGKEEEGDKLLRQIEKDLRGLDVAKEAREARLELYRSKKDMKEMKEKQQEEEASKILNLARMYEENNMPEKALAKYEEIVEKYPDTESGATAADRADKLRRSLGKEEKE